MDFSLIKRISLAGAV